MSADMDIQDEIDTALETGDEGEQGRQSSDDGGQESPEVRAKRMGWKPKEEYSGQNEWVDAEAFLQKAENDPVELRKMYRQLERSYSKLERNVEALVEHQEREITTREQEAYNRAMRDIEARHKQAVEEGDVDAASKAWKAREELAKAQPSGKVNLRKEEAPEFLMEWQKRNPWYGEDPVLSDAASKYTDILARKGVPPEKQLEQAEKYIRETFPHKFKKPSAPSMPGQNGNAVHKSSKAQPGTAEALKRDARIELDRFVALQVKMGKNGEKAKSEWLKYATPEMFEQ